MIVAVAEYPRFYGKAENNVWYVQFEPAGGLYYVACNGWIDRETFITLKAMQQYDTMHRCCFKQVQPDWEAMGVKFRWPFGRAQQVEEYVRDCHSKFGLS